MGRLRRKRVAPEAPPPDGIWQVPEWFNFTRDVVEVLADDYRLVLITKGDLLQQEQKLARSGLAERQHETLRVLVELLLGRDVLLPGGAPEPHRAELVVRFQQVTGPVMAKGIEDTAFYRHVRLLALNDVGGDPSRFGITVERFHAANRLRADRFPRNLLVTQTHDTKRSEDVRARLAVLSECALEWEEAVAGWRSAAGDR